jgi:hypothetical protein
MLGHGSQVLISPLLGMWHFEWMRWYDATMTAQSPKRKRTMQIALLLSLLATACSKRSPSACPIDGLPAQVTKRLDYKSCEYSHFSAIERQNHSWVADCEK